MPAPPNLRIRTYSESSVSVSTGPPSPTFTETTNASQILSDSGPTTIITRRNLRESLSAYEELLQHSEQYRAALSTMGRVSAAFAGSLERCARLKGVSDDSAVALQAAGGFQHVVANHWEVLANSLLSQFEQPLVGELKTYRSVVTQRSAAYEQALLEKSKIIKRTETESMNTRKRKQRDLQSFRTVLATLQAQVDELDRLKMEHYREVQEHEIQVWDSVLDKVAHVVRSQLDVFDRLTAKATDPILEPLLQGIPDPFDSYGPPLSEGDIVTVLAPLDLLAKTPMTANRPFSSPAYGLQNGRRLESDSAGPSPQSDLSEDPKQEIFPSSAPPHMLQHLSPPPTIRKLAQGLRRPTMMKEEKPPSASTEDGGSDSSCSTFGKEGKEGNDQTSDSEEGAGTNSRHGTIRFPAASSETSRLSAVPTFHDGATPRRSTFSSAEITLR